MDYPTDASAPTGIPLVWSIVRLVIAIINIQDLAIAHQAS